MKIGDRVLIVSAPENLSLRPSDDDDPDLETVFGCCVGKVFPIIDIVAESGLIELEVGEVFGGPAYMRSIWIEPEHLILQAD